MLKNINNLANVIIGCSVGTFIGHGMYQYWEMKKYSDLYAMQSTAWYTSVILWGCVTAAIVGIAVLVKVAVRKKMQ